MSISAMKQALEALETLDAGDTYKTHNAASALRQAIEQAEKPWVKTYAGGKPNYTAPVHASDMSQERVDETAKRKHEWVGLTDDEIKEIVGPWGPTPIKGYTRKLFDQIEAKLKEKNT
jgi:hypothetical protein